MLTGKCHCGAISYEAEGEPEHHALCHCTDCRGCAGAPMVGWIAFKEAQVRIKGTPVTYKSSEHGRRDFCGTCGTGLFYRNAPVFPGVVDIQSSTLDNAADMAPGAQIQAAERLPWVKQLNEIHAFERYPG
ncbi:GFA family protein [Sphingoaurantiacus capsulatus]|uniref:GFA family protein n=1 Tax=Sphingoaurantiacus capsulatus TaxID=1771310 RepID=A0ABV7XDE9_9SPHN